MQYSKPKGKEVLSAVYSLISDQRKLLWLPFLSSIFAFIAIIIVAIPVGVGAALTPSSNSTAQLIVGVIGLWLVLFVSTAIAVFFQVALVFGVNAIMDGEQPTLGWCIGQARGRIGKILAWSAVSATVGVILRLIGGAAAESNNIIAVILGFLIRFLGQAAWALASFFVVPIIVVQNQGPVASMKESVHLVKATFGTLIRSSVRFGIYQLVAVLAAIAIFGGGVVMVFGGGALVIPGVITIGIAIIGFAVIGCIFSVFGAALNAVMYRYATTGQLPSKNQETFESLSNWMVEAGQKKAAPKR